MLEEIKTLKKQASQRPREAGAGLSAEDLLADAQEIAGATVIVRAVGGISADEMRSSSTCCVDKRPEKLAVLLASTAADKVQLVAGVSQDLVQAGVHAGNWLKEVAPVVGGGGGGRPDLAQAGGKVPDQVPAAWRRPSRSSAPASAPEWP